MTDFLELFTICLIPLAMGWWPCMECCEVEDADTPCTDCTSTPKYMRIVVSGTLANQDCAECENIPATYILEQTGACTWDVNICNCDDTDPATLPTTSHVRMTQLFSFGTYKIQVDIRTEITSTNAIDIATFILDQGATKPDCKSYSGLSIPYSTTSPDGDVCGDWSALTVTVSATNGPADDESQCPWCDWQTMPDDFTASIAALTNDTGCDCSDTGDVTASRTFNDVDGCCRWEGQYVGDCGTWRYIINITETKITCTVQNDGGLGGSVVYEKVITTPIDCSANQTLTYTSGSFTECNNEAASTVTLVPV